MKRTSNADRLGWVATGVTVALFGTARWLPSQDAQPVDYGAAEPAMEHAEHEPADGKRPARRIRASSSMPYFSFARALHSEG